MKHDDDEVGPVTRGPASPKRSRYAGNAYEVGKGKPPREHQFKPGNKGGGRPKGSRNRTSLQKLLDKRVVVGHKNGRPVRKALRDIIDHKLAEAAMAGDMKAINLIKKHDLEMAKLHQGQLPDREEEARNLERRQELTGQIIKLLSMPHREIRELISLGVCSPAGNGELLPWVLTAMREHREKHGDPPDPEPDAPWTPTYVTKEAEASG